MSRAIAFSTVFSTCDLRQKKLSDLRLTCFRCSPDGALQDGCKLCADEGLTMFAKKVIDTTTMQCRGEGRFQVDTAA
jgi:hypothetical protein